MKNRIFNINILMISIFMFLVICNFSIASDFECWDSKLERTSVVDANLTSFILLPAINKKITKELISRKITRTFGLILEVEYLEKKKLRKQFNKALNGNKPEFIDKPNEYPWNIHGQIFAYFENNDNTPGGHFSAGSGALIDKDLVLSCAHDVWVGKNDEATIAEHKKLGINRYASGISFLPGYKAEFFGAKSIKSFFKKTFTNAQIIKEIFTNEWLYSSPNDHDIAVLLLRSRLDDIGKIDLPERALRRGDIQSGDVKITGYAGDSGLMVDMIAQDVTINHQEGTLSYYLQTGAGLSGAAIYVEEEDRFQYIVIHTLNITTQHNIDNNINHGEKKGVYLNNEKIRLVRRMINFLKLEHPENESEESKSDEAEALKRAREKAIKLYGEASGYVSVTNNIYYDKDGQKYVRVTLDGGKGDCCFHALGITREYMIEKIKAYIEECEEKLSDAAVKDRVDQSCDLRHLCDSIFTTAKDKDVQALKGHALSDWETKIIKIINDEDEKAQLNTAFDRMIKQQSANSVDWDEVLTSARQVRGLVKKNTSRDNELILYKEFVGKFIADLWKRVGDNQLTSKLESYLIKVGVLSMTGDQIERKRIDKTYLVFLALKDQKVKECAESITSLPQQNPKDENESDATNLSDEISILTLFEKELPDPKLKKYIQYKYEFPIADARRKCKILKKFYLDNHEWLDPSAIMHLGPRFGFKAKLFKEDDPSSPLRLDAQTPKADSDGELPCRLMIYVNDNHYDLLYPIRY